MIHSGPGADTLVTAAVAWQKLGIALEDAAEGYEAALSCLDDTWFGSTHATMRRAITPYVTWLRATALHAQRIAWSAQTAAEAFSSVQIAVTPLAVVMANRTRLAQLLSTNAFGRNLPAIAETEAAYHAMWAQNSAALTRYQATSTEACALPRFSSPTTATSLTPLSTEASSTPSPASGVSTAPGIAASSVGAAAAVPAAGDPSTGYVGLANAYTNQFISSGFPINLLSYLAQFQSAQALQGVNAQISQGVSAGENSLGASAGGLGGVSLAPAATGQVGSGLQALSAAGLGEVGTTSARMAVRVPMGMLSAPPAAAPLLQTPVHLAAAGSPLTTGEHLPVLPPLLPPPLSAGSGWRKRKPQTFDEIGAPLSTPVMKPPPSAG